MNGVYEPVPGQLHNGRAVYTKAGSSTLCLRYTLDDHWAVSRALDKDTNNDAGYAFSEEFGLALPEDVKSWKINDELQPSVQVVTLTAQVRVRMCVNVFTFVFVRCGLTRVPVGRMCMCVCV